MLESALRANVQRLYGLYHFMPYPVQNALTSARGLLLAKHRYANGTLRYLRELKSHEEWTTDQIVDYQRASLRRILDHARREVPFYSDYPPLRLTSPEDIAKLPVLHREAVRANPRWFVVRGQPESDCIRVGTTGTTGASLQVSYSESVARRNWAFHMRRWAWAGIKPRSPRVTFFGSRVVPPDRRMPPFWTHNYAEHQVLASIFHLSESNAPHYWSSFASKSTKYWRDFPRCWPFSLILF